MTHMGMTVAIAPKHAIKIAMDTIMSIAFFSLHLDLLAEILPLSSGAVKILPFSIAATLLLPSSIGATDDNIDDLAELVRSAAGVAEVLPYSMGAVLVDMGAKAEALPSSAEAFK